MTFINWFFGKKVVPELIDGIKSSDMPKAILWNFYGKPLLTIYDSSIVQDIFTSKGTIWDKTGIWAEVFEDAIGKSIVYSKIDDEWTRKRKISVHAFYRDRLANILEILKDKLALMIKWWHEEIEDCIEERVIIDIGAVFRELYTRCIIEAGLGEDLSAIQVEMNYLEDDSKGKKVVV